MPPRGISLSTWDTAYEEAHAAIVEAVRSAKGLITYGALTKKITCVSLEPDSEALRELLGDISTKESEEGRGMLSAAVVHQDDGRPGKGFFTLAEKLGRDARDHDRFWTTELRTVQEAWRRK
jgi:hypothetical protein